MADKIISATLKVNTGTAAADIGKVNKELDKTQEELAQTNEESKKTTGSFTNLKSGLDKIPGPLGSVNKGVETVSTSLKALAANPIVLVITLLVAALVALYKAFASTEAGAEKIEQIFSGLGAIVTVIRDRILALAGAVISFFKGDFKSAIEQTKAAVTGVGDAIVNAYDRATEATRRLQEATDNYNRNILVSRAELNKDLAKSKELISDETASYQDRKKAIEEVSAAQEAQAAKELAHFKELEDIAKDNADRDKNSSKYADELSKATIDRINAEQQAAQDARNINKQEHTIEQQAKAEADATSKKYHEAEMQRIAERQKAEQDAFNSRLDAIKFNQQAIDQGVADRAKAKEAQQKQDEADQKDRDAYQAGVDAKEVADYKKLIGAKLAEDKKADETDKKFKALKKAREEGALQTTSQLFAAAATLAGKNSAAGKAFAIAGATIDTYRGALAAFTGMTSTIPGPVGIALGIAAAAAAVINGLNTVKQIVSVKVPGGADAGGGHTISNPISNGAPAAPVAPLQAGTAIDQDSIRGIGNAVSGRSYVLESDITRDQSRTERLNRAARLGN
jgi:chemotaxis protein histidine kinase CheA